MAKTILEMKGISKSYGGIKALKDVKIELYEGEILCLLGENGAENLIRCYLTKRR